MTRVSKRELSTSYLKKLHKQLTKTIARLDHGTSTVFIDELLGKEEKIMIAKRFAAIVMLMENNSTYRIAQLLHMSPSTTERLRIQYRNGAYDGIEDMFLKNKKEYEEFWETLEVILRAGLPPRGKGRWKSTFDSLRK